MEQTHKEAKCLYQEYVAIGNALKQQLISAIYKTHLRGLRHDIYGYMNVNVLQMLTYLYENYGNMVPGDLTKNYKQLTALYDVSAPIKTLWEKIEDAIVFAGTADAPFTASQGNNTAYDLLH